MMTSDLNEAGSSFKSFSWWSSVEENLLLLSRCYFILKTRFSGILVLFENSERVFNFYPRISALTSMLAIIYERLPIVKE